MQSPCRAKTAATLPADSPRVGPEPHALCPEVTHVREAHRLHASAMGVRHTALTKANSLLSSRGTPIAHSHRMSLHGGCPMIHVRARLLVFLLQSLRALCMLCALSVLATSVASAQPGSPSSPELQLQYVPPMRSMEELQREYDSIRLWGPALGVPVSYLTVGGGVVMVAAANLDFCFYPPLHRRTAHTLGQGAHRLRQHRHRGRSRRFHRKHRAHRARRENESAGSASKWTNSASAASQQLLTTRANFRNA